jgi:hypothetical protein
LFSANAQVHQNVEQGPIPSLFTPASDNPRAAVEKRKETIRSSFIRPSERSKAELLKPKQLQLTGMKVPQDFVPACCVLSVLPAEERHRGASSREDKPRKVPFK